MTNYVTVRPELVEGRLMIAEAGFDRLSPNGFGVIHG